MTPSQPPRRAIRLMQFAGVDPAIIGDLVETFATGASAVWFWQQAIAAAAPSPLNALRWVAAIPLATYAGQLVLNRGSGLAWSMLGPAGMHGWRFYLPICVAAFLWSLTLVSIGTLVVPSRRRLVANCLLGIVGSIYGVALLLMLVAPSTGVWGFAILACGLLGGALAHGVALKQLDLRKT